MKKTLIASARDNMKNILLASTLSFITFCSVHAKADIVISNVTFDSDTFSGSGLTGSFTDAGDGYVGFRGIKFGSNDWDVYQQTTFIDNTGSWSGTSLQGAFNYDVEINAMTENQVAVGMYFNPLAFSQEEIAVLEIFDCVMGICTGAGVPMQNGPFADGSNAIVFSGTGSATVVPIPATAWLMGSGLMGLIGVACRREKQVERIISNQL